MNNHKCPICNKQSKKTNILHRNIKDAIIYNCTYCNWHYVNCDMYSKNNIYNHQSSHVTQFGLRPDRNKLYLEQLKDIIYNKKMNVSKILEIGTPQNYDLLNIIHDEFNDTIEYHSYDLIKSDFPSFIKFHNTTELLYKENFDIIFAIHVMEHIPSYELIDFVNLTKKIAKYYIIEVPACPTEKRVSASSNNPHYLFFTLNTIHQLYDIKNCISIDNIVKFNNITI